MPNSTDLPEPEIPGPVRSRQPSEQEPDDGANAVVRAVTSTETSQQPWKETAPLVSQSQDDGRSDADDEESNALQSRLSFADASTSLVAADAAPRKHGSGRRKKMKRGPKTGQPGSAASAEPSQQLQKERVPLVSQSQGDGRPDADDQDSSSAGAATSLLAVDTVQKKRGSGRPKKRKRGPKTGQPGSAAASQDTQSGSGGDTRPNSQGTATGKSKRGRGRPPPRDGIAPVDQEARVPTRQQPNRKITTKEKIGSIRDTAADPSRSTGKQTADVSNSRSRFNSTYLSARSAEDSGAEGSASPHSVGYQAARRKKEEEEQVLANDVDCEYRGPLLDGKSHGKGSVIWEDGTVYEGDFEHGYRTGEGKLIASDGVIFYVGGFYRGALTNGKRTYPDGGVFEGRFHLGGRSKGIYTYPDGSVFEGEYTWFDVRPKGSRASTKGLLTFNSEDDLLDFEGDIMALDPDIDGRSGRRGKMRWKDGSSFDGKWVAGEFDDGTLR